MAQPKLNLARRALFPSRTPPIHPLTHHPLVSATGPERQNTAILAEQKLVQETTWINKITL